MLINMSECSFSYGNKNVINSLNLNVPLGETIILLGHNGAGKTTLLKIIAKILKVDQGDISLGYDNCVLNLDTTQLLSELNCYDNLKYFSKLYKFNCTTEEINKIVADVGLEQYKDTKAKNLSTGNKQKLMIGRALLTNADLMLLDEPTSGLDPVSKKNIHDLLFKLKQNNKSVIIASHDLEETLQISDRILFMKDGEIIFDQSNSEVELILANKIYETNKYVDGFWELNDSINTMYIGLDKPDDTYTYTHRSIKLLDIYCLLLQGEYANFISKITVSK